MKIICLTASFLFIISCATTNSQNNTQPELIKFDLSRGDKLENPSSIELINAPLSSLCPEDMKHVSGMFCPEVVQNCIRYLDRADTKFARCAEFAPTICRSPEKIKLDFCVDTEEHHPINNSMPSSDVTFNIAAQECFQEGKRLCGEDEWTLACEGQEMYPHTTGYKRPSDRCNFDKTNLVVNGKFVRQIMSIDENKSCVSPFGMHNMNGNVDEWVVTKQPFYAGGSKLWSGLKGGWWGALRDRCRPMTVGHGLEYHDVQTGFRCCKDSK